MVFRLEHFLGYSWCAYIHRTGDVQVTRHKRFLTTLNKFFKRTFLYQYYYVCLCFYLQPCTSFGEVCGKVYHSCILLQEYKSLLPCLFVEIVLVLDVVN